MEKYVYVIYDPLHEKVVCVHDEPEKSCLLCELINEERDKLRKYYLEEHKHLIQTKLR
jgi:hypothetical protein